MKSTPSLQNPGLLQIKAVAQQGFAAPQVWNTTWAPRGRGRAPVQPAAGTVQEIKSCVLIFLWLEMDNS